MNQMFSFCRLSWSIAYPFAPKNQIFVFRPPDGRRPGVRAAQNLQSLPGAQYRSGGRFTCAFLIHEDMLGVCLSFILVHDRGYGCTMNVAGSSVHSLHVHIQFG